MDLKRLTARVAGHIEAIEAAKKAGMTWGEMAPLFNASSAEAIRKAFARAQRGIEAGRIVPIEQLPLPSGDRKPPAPALKPTISRSPPPLPGQKIRDDGFNFD